MCPNCEGNVALEVSICPYCGSSVFDTNDNLANQAHSDDIKSLSYEETLASLYPPPYKPSIIDTSESYEKEEEDFSKKEEKDLKSKEDVKIKKSAFSSTILFWTGVNIFIFSLLLLCFSDNGVLYLKWNGSFWFLYTLLSLPLLYFGFKGLKNLD